MQNLEEIQKILAFLNDEEIENILNQLKEKEIKIINIENGLEMLTLKDSFDNPFYLGEILVSHAEVEWKEYRGYGMIIGSDERKALIMAYIDLLLMIGEKDFLNNINEVLEIGKKRMEEFRNKEKILVLSTKVNFENMAEG